MAANPKKIRLIFSRSHLPFSYAVRVVTWSPWSHVGILMDDGRVVESTFSHHGVKIDTLNNFKSRAQAWQIVELDCNDRQAIIDAAVSQLDKPYDWAALFGIIFHNGQWQEDDCWFCSELVAYAFYMGGTPLFNKEVTHRITPEDVWKVPHKLIASSM